MGSHSDSSDRPANYGNLALSPDGKTVMVNRSESNTSHMWAGEVARGVFSRPNPGGAVELSPCALPDGRVVFTYHPPGAAGDIYVSAGNGTGAPEAWVRVREYQARQPMLGRALPHLRRP